MISRRAFIQGATASLLGLGCKRNSLDSIYPYLKFTFSSEILSDKGCGRATAFNNGVKVVTFENKTHITWLDAWENQFWVRLRTLDRITGRWSEIYTLDSVNSNHGGATLAVDPLGFLHIAYGGNASQTRYRVSRYPNNISEWGNTDQVGTWTGFPAMLIGSDNTVYLVTTNQQLPMGEVELYVKHPERTWEKRATLLRKRLSGYSSFSPSLVWSPDRKTIHLTSLIFEGSDAEAYGRVQTLTYMQSKDFGFSWAGSSGTPLSLPATSETVELLAQGGVEKKSVLFVGTIDVEKNGLPMLTYTVQEGVKSRLYLLYFTGKEWKRNNLSNYIPPEYADWMVCDPGNLVYRENRISIVSTLQKITMDDLYPKALSAWAHLSNEVVLFEGSDVAGSFSFQMISSLDSKKAQWLPTLERQVGFNQIPDQLQILYTSGNPGKNNYDMVQNKVVWLTEVAKTPNLRN